MLRIQNSERLCLLENCVRVTSLTRRSHLFRFELNPILLGDVSTLSAHWAELFGFSKESSAAQFFCRSCLYSLLDASLDRFLLYLWDMLGTGNILPLFCITRGSSSYLCTQWNTHSSDRFNENQCKIQRERTQIFIVFLKRNENKCSRYKTIKKIA